MAQRLTTFSKLLIVGLLTAAAGFGIIKLKNSGMLGGGGGSSSGGDSGSTKDVIKVGVVTWGGYAGGQYFNEGFKANKDSRFYKDYGFQVEFKVLDDFTASRDAFKSDDVDLLWTTVDAFPCEVEGLKDFDPRIVFQADWSRGGDAIVSRRGINTVADLRGKKVAVAPMTPSHTFLLWMLEAGNMTKDDISIVEVPSAIDAADAFKSGAVDAAVVWSPDDADCVAKVPGAKILQSSKNASNIIADVFVAKKKFIDGHKVQLQQLYEGWMKGAAEINSSESNKQKAAKILADGLSQPEDFCYAAINNTRLATHGDNRNFYGLNSDYSGVKGEDLWNKMKDVYSKLGYAPSNVRSWRLVADMDAIKNTNLSGSEHDAEKGKSFAPVTTADQTKEAISTKRVTIAFGSGSSTLDDNAKYIIDRELTDLAKAFANARIRIEGNTDNVGAAATNKALSLKRANAVADYLVNQHNMPRNRFIIVGNGPDKPVADNTTDEGKAKNRRTDFEIVAE